MKIEKNKEEVKSKNKTEEIEAINTSRDILKDQKSKLSENLGALGEEQKKPDHEKTTKIIVFIMVGILSVFFIILLVNQLSPKAEYSGIEFKKNYVGQILFYTAQVPMFSQGQITGYLALDFRNNPADL